GEKLIIPDDSAVPEQWTKVERRIDAQRIKAALKGGLEVNWAAIERSPETISVRTK
ncbi:MAG: siphovirus Gp157 family protein, partial [Rhizobiales bacterium]|nr:siphovirus Gp157 family protein [Hyphomicrobiales bacterium]